MAAKANERWSLAGVTALVTGGSKGIGHAIVEELASFGSRVHTCSRNATELEECHRRWAEKGLQVTVSVCDVGVRAEREALMGAVKDAFAGRLDILVNNAAQVMFKPTTECTAEDYSQLMATNLESCFHLSQLVHPMLRRSTIAGGGSIVHISSVGSCLGCPNIAIYATAKGGMNQLTRSLAVEWAPDKIRVNCVAPGTVVTDMAKQVRGMNQLTRSLAVEWAPDKIRVNCVAPGSKLGGVRARISADSTASRRGASRRGIRGVVPVFASGVIRHRPGHLP